jgi:hypothetical protein
MGTEIVVDVVPQRIDPAAWAEAFDETLGLLERHPARLVGCDLRVAAGVPVEVLTRSIDRGGGDAGPRRWCVAGSMGSFGAGEPQSMVRDLLFYVDPRRTGDDARGPDDLLLHAARDAESTRFGPTALTRGGAGPIARVLGGRVPGPACRLPLLAAAMVIEGRFPRHAMVHGDVDRDLAEAARRWAAGALGRPVALPVRVDAWRLVERLGAHFEGEALVRAVDRLYLADPARKDAALFGIFGRAEAEPWWLGKLRAHPHPASPGAMRLFAAYVEATHDVARMRALACSDPRGPRYAPDDLAEALAALDTNGAHVPARRPEGEVEAALALSSAADLSPAQRDHILALACLARRHVVSSAEPPAALRRTIATLLAQNGPVLTEDAWAWIEREDDADVLGLLAALAALETRDPDLGRARRVLFESRPLCCHAAAALRDGPLMAAVAERLEAAARA